MKRFMPYLPLLLVLTFWIGAIVITGSDVLLALLCIWAAGLLVVAFLKGKR